MYPKIRYDKSEVNDYSTNTSASNLFDFIVKIINPKYDLYCDDLPKEEDLVVKEYGYVNSEYGSGYELVDLDKISEFTYGSKKRQILLAGTMNLR